MGVQTSYNPFKREIDCFLMLADVLNVSRASGRLGITQPGLSKTIQRLEAEAGKALFLRRNTGLELTPEGRRMREQFEALRRDWDQRNRLSSPGDDAALRGTFRFGCHPTVGMSALPSFLPALAEAHPGIDPKIVLDTSREVTRRVLEGELDFGLVANPERFRSLVIRTLAREKVGAFGLAGTTARTLWYNPDMLGVGPMLKNFPEHRAIPLRDYSVIAALVNAGGGLGILPDPAARPFANLTLVGKPLAEVALCLVYRAEKKLDPAYRRISAFIQARPFPTSVM